MPTGSRVSLSAAVLGAWMVIVPIIVGMIGDGPSVLISSVVASIAVGVSLVPPKNLIRISQSSCGFRVRLIEVAAAWASKGVPSWNLTPSRSLKRQVFSSTCSQLVARRGFTLLSLGSISVSVSATFCFTIRPMLERLAWQGSTMSGSSGSTMVRSRSCANALPPAQREREERATATRPAGRPGTVSCCLPVLCLIDSRRSSRRPVSTATGSGRACRRAGAA